MQARRENKGEVKIYIDWRQLLDSLDFQRLGDILGETNKCLQEIIHKDYRIHKDCRMKEILDQEGISMEGDQNS